MADLKENAIGLLSSTALVPVGVGAATTPLFTVPVGKVAIITHVVVHTPSGTLVGGIDYDFGVPAPCTEWKQTQSLATMIATTHFFVITENNTVQDIYAAGVAFAIKPSTGATAAAATATIDVFGYLYDA